MATARSSKAKGRLGQQEIRVAAAGAADLNLGCVFLGLGSSTSARDLEIVVGSILAYSQDLATIPDPSQVTFANLELV